MIEDIFLPLSDQSRQNIAGLRQPEPFADSTLPGWARTLITHHSVLDVSVAELESLGLDNLERTDEGIAVAYEGIRIDFTPGGQAIATAATPDVPGDAGAEDEWMHPRITDYWDDTAGAIGAAGRRLEALGDAGQKAAMVQIAAAMERHVSVLNDEFLVAAAVSFVDDLYKSASEIGWWDPHLQAYLMASAATFSRHLSRRGIRIQSLVDNAWDDPARLIGLFPDWFRAAGIIFISPQMLVRNLAQRDGIESESEIPALMPRYIDEARRVADTLLAQCQDEQRHFLFLDTDAVESSFDQARKRVGTEGVLTVIRSEAPTPGSNVSVVGPKGIAFPPTGA